MKVSVIYGQTHSRVKKVRNDSYRTADISVEMNENAGYNDQRSVSMENTGYFDEIKELFRESERRMKEIQEETNRQMKETDRKLRELGAQVGGLGNRLGEFVEGLVRPALVEIFSERGIAVHQK